MTLPKDIERVVVGVRTYEVWRDEDAATATGARGQALADEGKVMIDPRLPRDVQLLTLVHESIHLALEQSPLTAGKQVKGEQPDIDDLLEEKIATWLESFIPQFCRDNPRLMGELTDV